MANKWLYVFKDPFGSGDVKIGITSNPKSRLGTYQNAYSVRSHRACFDFVWAGPASQIDRLERALKDNFHWEIASDTLGESEWVQDVGLEKIIEIVNRMIEGWKFHISTLNQQFPITINEVGYKVD